jgi:hypothetical protein
LELHKKGSKDSQSLNINNINININFNNDKDKDKDEKTGSDTHKESHPESHGGAGRNLNIDASGGLNGQNPNFKKKQFNYNGLGDFSQKISIINLFKKQDRANILKDKGSTDLYSPGSSTNAGTIGLFGSNHGLPKDGQQPWTAKTPSHATSAGKNSLKISKEIDAKLSNLFKKKHSDQIVSNVKNSEIFGKKNSEHLNNIMLEIHSHSKEPILEQDILTMKEPTTKMKPKRGNSSAKVVSNSMNLKKKSIDLNKKVINFYKSVDKNALISRKSKDKEFDFKNHSGNHVKDIEAEI